MHQREPPYTHKEAVLTQQDTRDARSVLEAESKIMLTLGFVGFGTDPSFRLGCGVKAE